MASQSDNKLFSELFKILDVDCDHSNGESNENVNRIHGEGINTKSDLIVDIYSPLLSLSINSLIRVELVNNVRDSCEQPIREDDDYSLDKDYKKYDYVVDGRIYKITDKIIGDVPVLAVYSSFGGLLMRLQSDPSNLRHLIIDQKLFLCIKISKKNKS